MHLRPFNSKKMKHLLILFIGIIWSCGTVYAQTYKEFLKKQQEQFKKIKQSQEEGIKKLRQDYDDFVKNQDKEFSEFLQKTWKAFETMAGEVPELDEPKPKEAPVALKESAGEEVRLRGETGTEKEKPGLEPLARIRKSSQPAYEQKIVEVDFYGNRHALSPDRALCVAFTGDLNEKNIADYWLRCSEANYDDLLDVLFSLKEQMGLNDWGYYMFVSRLASACVEDENSRQLLTWFLLNKSGYVANIGYGSGQATLLLPAQQKIYFMPYITKDNRPYYMARKVDNVQTYEGRFPGCDRYMDLRFKSALNFPDTYVQQREIDFRGRRLNLTYNAMATRFYKDYPSTVLDVYFNAPVSGILKESLAENLMPLLDSLSKEEQVSTLLTLLHESFPYQTDQEQFGHEKYFFAEEMMAYPYSDCEDRAVFFSYLVRTFAGLPEIGLSYPGHVATAVCLDEDKTGGDYFLYRQKRYWVCDPTYIGASVGMAMPDLAKQTAEIIPVSDYLISRNREEQIVNLIQAAGGTLLNPYDHMAYDDQGNVYVAGVFDERFTAGDRILEAPAKSRNIFVGKVDSLNRLSWAITVGGEGVDFPQQLKLRQDTLLLSGMFEGRAYFGKDTLEAKQERDLFVSEIDGGGNIVWAAQGNLRGDTASNNCNYLVKFDRQGQVVENRMQPDWPGLFDEGITLTPRQEIIVTGTFNRWGTVLLAEAVEKLASLDVSDRLKELNDDQLQRHTEKGIAGLLALINMVESEPVALSGEMAAKTLDKFNPSFKDRCPTIYKNICMITFLRNEEGIIMLKTQHGKNVNFDKVRVKDGGKMKIVKLPEGDVKVEVISNIVVGKAFIWFPLNSVTLFRKSGDMLFDYDKDHTLRTFNLTKDILK